MMKELSKAKKSMLGMFVAFALIIIAMLASADMVYAEYDGCTTIEFSGSSVIWDEATYYDSLGRPTDCKYSLYITDTRDNVLYSIKDLPVHTTSQDLTDILINNNLVNTEIKCKVRAFPYDEPETDRPTPFVYTDPVKFHYVYFVVDGLTYEYILAFEGGMIDRIEPPEHPGDEFVGWYEDTEFTDIWDFRNDRMGNTNKNLYAKYVEAGQHNHDGITFTAWANDSSLPTEPGHYYLTQNVHLSSGWNPPDGVDLCLNGKQISSDSNAIDLNRSGATINIFDCGEDDPGMITGCKRGGVTVFAGNLIWHGGNIVSNRYEDGSPSGRGGGGVTLEGGTFEFLDGEISNNYTVGRGGAVDVDGGTFRMRGGLITNNTAVPATGGSTGEVVLANSAHFEISGGTITSTKTCIQYVASSNNGGPIKIIPKEGSDTTDDINIAGNNQNVNMCYGPGNDPVPLVIEAKLSANTRIGLSVDNVYKPKAGEPSVISSGFYGNAVIGNFINDQEGQYELELQGEGTSQELAFKVRHKISFDGNGAEGEMEEAVVVDGHDYDLPGNGFDVPVGHTFGGWKIGNDTYNAGDTLENVINSATAKAVWTPIEYELAYDLGGGLLPDGEENPASYTVKSEDIHLYNPQTLGYEFLGWTWEGQDEPSKDVTIVKGSTGDRSFTANWEIIQYDLTYKLSGGALPEGESNPVSFSVETETFTLVNPVKDGCLFSGWYLKGTDGDEQPLVTIPKGSIGSRTYIAMWESAYRVQVAPGIEHGEVSVNKTTSLGNEEIEITVTPDSKYKCLVVGIKVTDYEGNNIQVSDSGSSNKYKFNMPESDVLITAEFEPITVDYINVRTYKDGITLRPDETTTDRIVAIAEPTNALNRGLDYKILDPEVAELVDGNHVHALKCGATSLVISSTDGSDKKAYIQIAVLHPEEKTKVDAVAPTCEEDGTVEHYKCDYCGQLFIKTETEDYRDVTEDDIKDPALGHDYGAWVSDGEDEHKRVCSHDESHFEREPHVWNDGEITKQPTAEQEGEKTYTCTVCGAARTEVIPNTSEKLTAAEAKIKELEQKLEDSEALSDSEKKALEAELESLIKASVKISASGIKTKENYSRKTMKVSWSKVSGATDYVVAYKTAAAKQWTEKQTGGKTSLTIKGLKAKGLYQFKVRGARKVSGTLYYGNWSKTGYKYFAKTTQKLTGKKRQIIVKVKRVKGATGYKVLYGTKKSISAAKVKTTKGAGKVKIKVGSLKSKKTYYVRVYPYKKAGGKTYTGIMSAVKKVKTK